MKKPKTGRMPKALADYWNRVNAGRAKHPMKKKR